ncbi:helix-turn-helix domain-containing protein [Senegalimassilia faecalis]|nr:helix-turn-helix domain-containing protein [Senegalimassilia faecalis]
MCAGTRPWPGTTRRHRAVFHDELAEMLGVHVNSITNSVSALRKAECVERQRGALVITDFKKLKNVAENLIVKK